MMRRFVISFRSLNKQFSTNYYQFDLFKHCERIKIRTKTKKSSLLYGNNCAAKIESPLHKKLGLGLKVWEERMQKKTF